MNSRFRFNWRGALVTAVAVALTLGAVAGGVLAQTPPTPTPGTAGGPGAAATDFFNRLAGKLGLAPERVTTAAKEVQKEQIDAAVQAGRLTPEQAAKMKERIDAGQFFPGKPGPGGPGGRGKGGPGGIGGPAMADMTALASWLGITPEALRTELNGKSLAQVAQAHGKSRDALITFLTDSVKKRLDEAVTAGRLTRQQADQMLERFKGQVGTMVDRVHTPGQRVGPGRGPGGPGRGPGGPGSPAPTPTRTSGNA